VSDIAAWHDYFVTVAQVSATLAGLLFVGVTISLNHMLGGRGYLYRAWAALFLQFEMLVVALSGLIPGQPAWLLAAEIIVVALGVLTAIRVFGHFFPEDENSKVLGSKGARAIRETLIHVATLLPVVAAIALIANFGQPFAWLIPAEVISLYLSFGLAWVFAIEIPRRLEEEKAAKNNPP